MACRHGDADECSCWELEAGKYVHGSQQQQDRLDELRRQFYGPTRRPDGSSTQGKKGN